MSFQSKKHICFIALKAPMTEEKVHKIKDRDTEETIKIAARIIFHQKGYAATRTRDIAQEAGISLALLNYYFRSKGRLYSIIIEETLTHFFNKLSEIFYDENTSLEKKINLLIDHYIDLLIHHPNIPLFLINELKSGPNELMERLKMKEMTMNSVFYRQMTQATMEGRIAPLHPLHFMVNVMAMTLFPFIASPLVRQLGDLSPEEFNQLMEERKRLIPIWVEGMLAVR